MRKMTEFQGWANDLDFLAEEAELEKKHAATVRLYKRDEATEQARSRLGWTIGFCIMGIFLFGLYWLLSAVSNMLARAGL
jgi:hypothetical protein